MMKNWLNEKLLSSTPSLGIWSIIGAATNIEIAAEAGLSFQILDMEHGVFDVQTLEHCVRACELRSCSPLIRIPTLNSAIVQNVLDIGAHGIVVPQVKNYEDAVSAVKFSKFMPQGIRGLNPFTRANDYMSCRNSSGKKLNNDFPITCIIIENKTAYLDLDKILEIDGIDLIYLGVYDMSCSLGVPGQIDHPDVEKFLEVSIEKCKAAKKAVGIMVKAASQFQKYLDLGATCIVAGVDTHLYFSAISNHVVSFEQAVEKRSKD